MTNQPELRTRTPVPNESSQENQGLSTGEEPYIPPSAIATTMLDQQWNLFQRARQARNVPLMRTALQQAISTQELLTNLVGHEEMLRVSLQWIARDEMNLLEQSVQNDAMQLSTTPASSPTVPMVMSTPHLPGMNNTAPVPTTNAIRHVQRQNMRRPTPEITYLGRTHSATRVPLTPPPPPLIPPPTTHQVYQNQPVAIRPAMIPQNYANPQPQPHYGHQQPHYQNQPPNGPPPFQRGPNRAPGWRRPDNTTRMVPSAQSASDPSSTEEFFNNINSQFIPDTTFLLEDKILLHHVEKNNMDRENIVSMKDEIAPLKDFIKENIECVQDICQAWV
ncbi:hypothetical protein PSHT_09592 [Puccinia striiformis]|uniref:Uncharacterized protein n=1 Tax=Puccinia striiformis TaxID=27350 RepID=A0A2S4VFJ7_9BASI|nr:hypothetical protein PSHT_09592 [Puccinia striiformis]